MKRLVAILIVIMGMSFIPLILVQYGLGTDIKGTIEKRFSDAFKKDSEKWKEWKKGLKSDYNFDLRDFAVTIEILDQQTEGDDLLAITNITIVAYVVDNSGIKKRFIRRMVVGYLFDRDGCEIKFEKILELTDSIIGGWDGKDV